jgi:phage terminase large subunit GpA-like protein
MSALRPPPKMRLSEWADAHFVLSAESSAEPGRWRTLAYQRGIMDAITDPNVERVSLKKSARIGYTKMVNAAIGYHVHQDPCPILVVQPTVEDAEGYSKEEIAPMVRDCEVLTDLVGAAPPRRGRPKKGAKKDSITKTSAETILLKAFPGGVLSMVGANSGRGLRRVSRRVVILDEVDGYPASAGNDGDPVKLAERRAEYYWNRKIIAGSTPLIAGTSRIDDLYEAGDRRRYYVPCPHCGHMDYLKWSGESGDASGHVMRFPDGPASAHFECSSCHGKIEESSKREIIERGEWRAQGDFTGHASFHIWAAYSSSPNASWSQLVQEFLDAKSDPLKLKTFVNTVLGETWQERGDAPDWERLFNRRETYKIGTVPDGPIILTAGVDVQKDRFVYEVVGWGANKESWSIDAGEIFGDTALEATWGKLDDELLARAYLGTDGAAYTISMLAVDSGYNTQMAYAWSRGNPRAMAVKGASGARAMLLGSPSKVDLTIGGKRIARGQRLWPVGGDVAKSELYGFLRLTLGEGGEAPSGYCHFPEHGEWYFKQLTSEHLVTIVNRKTRQTRREWHVLPNRENHILDARVYARAAAARLRIDQIGAAQRAKAPVAKAHAPAAAPPPKSPPPVPDAPPLPQASGETGRPSGFWNRPRVGGLFGRRR